MTPGPCGIDPDQGRSNVEVELPGFHSPLDPSRALRIGGRGLPREHVIQVQRERIIDGFVQVVAENGYEGAGIKAICRRAGVAFNTFYEFFSTKEELFLVTFDTGTAALVQGASAAFLDSDVSWQERIEGSIRRFLQILADNPNFTTFLMVEAHKAGREAMHRIDREFTTAFSLFSEIAPVTGISMTTDELMPLVIGGIYTRIYFYVLTGKIDRLPELLPQFMEFVTALFADRPPEAADEP